MLDRSLPQLGGSEWALLDRSTDQVMPPSKSMLPKVWAIQGSWVLAVSIYSVNSKPNWITGGWASMVLPFSPGLTTFPQEIRSYQRRVFLGRSTLLVLPKLADQYSLQIEFPRWLRDYQLEIWRYLGTDTDIFKRFDDLETKIDLL